MNQLLNWPSIAHDVFTGIIPRRYAATVLDQCEEARLLIERQGTGQTWPDALPYAPLPARALFCWGVWHDAVYKIV